MNRALIIVDMQVDFVTGSLGTKEAERIVPAVVKKIETEKENGAQIIFTKDTHETNYLQTQEGRKLPVKHCIRQTEGWQIIPELKAYTSDAKIIEKPTFGSVELAKELMNADQITLIGLCTDICVISNALLLKAYYPEKNDSGGCFLLCGCNTAVSRKCSFGNENVSDRYHWRTEQKG